jgi:hypothetical protein
LSSPLAKNISLRRLVETALLIPPSYPTEGRLEIVTDAGQDAVDADGAARRAHLTRTEKSCGPDAPTLASSSREASFSGMRVARKPVTRESAKETVKTIARGMPGETGVT